MAAEESTTLLEKIKLKCHENCKCAGLEFAVNLADLTAEPIGDGNLNDVIRVISPTFKGPNSAIAKRGPPYIKCLGPEYPLNVNRTKLEYSAITRYNSIVPGCVSKPLCWVGDCNMFFVEDLKDFEVLRKLLINGVDCEKAILKLAKEIGIIHNETHYTKVPRNEFTEMAEEFRNEDMVSLTKQFVFTAPFVKGEPTNRCADNVIPVLSQIYDDATVLNAADKMKQMFLERKESLLHGDLHTGSIMAATDGSDAKMIDLEFAYVGPCAFDVGMFLANLIFTYYQHMSTPQNNDVHRQYSYSIVDLCKSFVDVYLQHMTCIGDHESFVSEVAGFCGCEIVRRIVGAAHVEDLKNSEYVEQDALGSGIRLLRAMHRIHTIDRLMVIALMLA